MFHEILDVPEAAKHLRLSERSIRAMLRQGRLPGRRLGKEWRMSKKAIDEFLAEPSFTFTNAPADDEAFTAEERAAVEEALTAAERGEVVTHEEARHILLETS